MKNHIRNNLPNTFTECCFHAAKDNCKGYISRKNSQSSVSTQFGAIDNTTNNNAGSLYQTDQHRLYLTGVNFSSETRTVEKWTVSDLRIYMPATSA